MYGILPAVLMVVALPAMAEGFQPVREEAEFRALVEGRELHYGMFGINLTIGADGSIDGRAMGAPVTGNWAWKDGFFCRDLGWQGRDFGYDCQLVEAHDARLRFTSDKGEGQSAAFALR